VPAVSIKQDGVADLVFAAQAGQVLLGRLRRFEHQSGNAIVSDHLGQHAQVPNHLAS
jgi:hypothetical protein